MKRGAPGKQTVHTKLNSFVERQLFHGGSRSFPTGQAIDKERRVDRTEFLFVHRSVLSHARNNIRRMPWKNTIWYAFVVVVSF